jgi:hypothetical protein
MSKAKDRDAQTRPCFGAEHDRHRAGLVLAQDEALGAGRFGDGEPGGVLAGQSGMGVEAQGDSPDIGQANRAGGRARVGELKTIGHLRQRRGTERAHTRFGAGHARPRDVGGDIGHVLPGEASAQRRHLRDRADRIVDPRGIVGDAAEAVQRPGHAPMAVDAADTRTAETTDFVVEPLAAQRILPEGRRRRGGKRKADEEKGSQGPPPSRRA